MPVRIMLGFYDARPARVLYKFRSDCHADFGPLASRQARLREDTMRVAVDLTKCTGHGICESIAEDVFEVQDDGSVLIRNDERPESDRDRMQKAVIQCPAAALRLEN
jgi:ferredoxin